MGSQPTDIEMCAGQSGEICTSGLTALGTEALSDSKSLEDAMSSAICTTDKEMERYRRIIIESSGISSESDERIFFVGRIIQYVIDREFNKDSVQLAQEFNKQSSSNSDSANAILSKSKVIGPFYAPNGMRLEP